MLPRAGVGRLLRVCVRTDESYTEGPGFSAAFKIDIIQFQWFRHRWSENIKMSSHIHSDRCCSRWHWRTAQISVSPSSPSLPSPSIPFPSSLPSVCRPGDGPPGPVRRFPDQIVPRVLRFSPGLLCEGLKSFGQRPSQDSDPGQLSCLLHLPPQQCCESQIEGLKSSHELNQFPQTFQVYMT